MVTDNRPEFRDGIESLAQFQMADVLRGRLPFYTTGKLIWGVIGDAIGSP